MSAKKFLSSFISLLFSASTSASVSVLLLISFSLLISSTSNAKVYSLAEYPYPLTNPYQATLSFALARPEKSFLKFRTILLHPERNSVPFYEKRAAFYFGQALQPGIAPLAFLMPGTGGSAEEDGLQFIAQQLYKNGYHVITISNPFSWQFSLAVSRTGVVGFAPADLQDLTVLLAELQKKLKSEGVLVSSYNLIGYSLGAAYTGFLAVQEQKNPQLQINKFVLLNPPLSFAKNLAHVEKFYDLGKNVSSETKGMIKAKIIDIGLRYLENPDAIPITEIGKQLGLSDGALKWVISDTFRSSLAQVLFTTQNIHDLGLLKTPANSRNISQREEEAKQFTFFDYMRLVVQPTLARDISEEQMLELNSLKSVTSELKKNKRIYIFHNQDDFLFEPEDLQWIQNTVGDERSFIYPHGGHMGNTWFPINAKDFLSVMLKP